MSFVHVPLVKRVCFMQNKNTYMHIGTTLWSICIVSLTAKFVEGWLGTTIIPFLALLQSSWCYTCICEWSEYQPVFQVGCTISVTVGCHRLTTSSYWHLEVEERVRTGIGCGFAGCLPANHGMRKFTHLHAEIIQLLHMCTVCVHGLLSFQNQTSAHCGLIKK